MIERVRTNWRLFSGGRAGLRFRERYRLRQGRRRRNARGRFDLARPLYVASGLLLVALSALFGWLPVLGWGTAIVGLAMIAGEYYPVARLMDRLELGARRLFGPLGKAVVGLPAWARLSVSLTIAVSTLALVYGIFSLTMGA